MAHNNVSEALLEGMSAALDVWANRFDGEGDSLYWVLRIKAAEADAGATAGSVLGAVPAEVREQVTEHLRADADYWDNVRYANLDRVTQLWGVVVNTARVAAESPVATDEQKRVFDYGPASLFAFLRAARERMEVADQLYHCFRPMPAPECQALGALLNVHIDAPLDESLMCRLVRLLDAEGPLSDEEAADLDTLANTGLVAAAFRGARGH